METHLVKHIQNKEIKKHIQAFKQELERRNRASQFDWFAYLQDNPELYNSGIYSIQGLYVYWQKKDRKVEEVDEADNDTKPNYILLPSRESRFSWEYYLFFNPDLGKHGIHVQESAVKHWIMHGHRENRQYSVPGFDWIFYIFYNSLLNYGITTRIAAL